MLYRAKHCRIHGDASYPIHTHKTRKEEASPSFKGMRSIKEVHLQPLSALNLLPHMAYGTTSFYAIFLKNNHKYLLCKGA